MNAELPPLFTYYDIAHGMVEVAKVADVEARERILQARIRKLETVLANFDERWLMDGELGFCVACGVSIEAGDAHKPGCWLAQARAAIDAARKA